MLNMCFDYEQVLVLGGLWIIAPSTFGVRNIKVVVFQYSEKHLGGF